MGNAGYLPLVHSHAGANPNYIVNVKAIEETRDANLEKYPHKLFFRPATVLPDLPYGHTVSGEVAGQHDGSVAPDVMAFIVMDCNDSRSYLGPRLFFLDKLVSAVGREAVEKLENKDFQIIPDKSIGDSRFGAIDSIELVGTSGINTRFMKFDYFRVEPASRTTNVDRARRAIWALRNALDNKDGAAWTDPEPGDVLLVNNWRAATAWDEECRTWNSSRLAQFYLGRLIHVHSGDRVVFQMNFYLPKEEFALEEVGYDQASGGNGASGH